MQAAIRRLVHPARILTLILMLGLGTTAQAAGGGKPEKTYPGYLPLEPALVVNLDNPRRPQYLQIQAQFYVETAEDAAKLEKHMPVVRDRLITFFGGRDPEAVQKASNRETLRSEALARLQETMQEITGSQAVSNLYFTGFIVQ
ncbi:flagellar basal body-associated FliL family protein [Ectothiorhodospira mobilis]|uniref:flagellar basal body-associated FliL family protein n=1 Tax=Ectothiorhodospira mobilis TaxID=195064 RepID=UPI001907FDE5|nr:flagellar basal body-associated FliL family protein [Ectothiorhodospira mobilis]MBK1691647.1 flagellar basal body rod protein [Ectothiorhodospira mobilis]